MKCEYCHIGDLELLYSIEKNKSWVCTYECTGCKNKSIKHQETKPRVKKKMENETINDDINMCFELAAKNNSIIDQLPTQTKAVYDKLQETRKLILGADK